MLKLVGSTTSPYVRRVRFMLENQDYEFECVNVFSEEGQAVVAQYTTTRRIPLLVDGETIIWDSLLIAEYLSQDGLTLETKKDLTLINEMTDSGVQLFQLRKFETDPEDKGLFSVNNIKRIHNIMQYFESKKIEPWDIIAQWLFCTLDWFEFRKVIEVKQYPQLNSFYESHQQKEIVASTDPRN